MCCEFDRGVSLTGELLRVPELLSQSADLAGTKTRRGAALASSSQSGPSPNSLRRKNEPMVVSVVGAQSQDRVEVLPVAASIAKTPRVRSLAAKSMRPSFANAKAEGELTP